MKIHSRTVIRLTALLALLVLQTGRAAETFSNPILPGFHPDPSICRVGDDYYLVNSSFEYFPGVPIFHSQDLVHWEPIGHVLTRKSQLNLDHARASGGIYAPTLRWHNGTFYLITTLVDRGGNFFVTATNAAGPWSEPVWIDASGIDPSLLFDDDGAVYYTRHEGMGDGSIAQAKLDVRSGKLDGPLRNIWRGTGGVWPEGPHLYKIHGKYYLMIAEGGTSYGHSITMARSDSPWGPFEADPKNPVLTHRDQPALPIQALGHGDLVETPDGWWLVCLGIRPQAGNFHHLGRETFLTRASWPSDGWPSVAPVELQMTAPQMPQHAFQLAPARDEFNHQQLGQQWNFLRNPREENYSLTERPGWLRLRGTAVTLNDQDSPTFIGRRQTDLNCTVATRLDFQPRHTNEEAGLVLRGNDKNHCEIGITFHNGERMVFFRKIRDGKIVEPVVYAGAAAKRVTLSIKASPLQYEFFFSASSAASTSLGKVPTRDLSSEAVGGFTGVYAGLFATGNGQTNSVPADFDWFDYEAK